MHEEAWSCLLRAFDPEPREAARRLHALINKLVRIFEWRGCREPDEAAYELVNRLAAKIQQGVELTTSIERYASGFIHPILYEHLRREKRDQAMLDSLAIGASEVAEEPEESREAELSCLDDCIEQELSGADREMLLDFHAHDGSERIKTRRNMAQARRKTANALRIEAHRLRKRLRRCVEACLRPRQSADENPQQPETDELPP